MHFYKIEYSHNPAKMWRNLKTADPTERSNYSSLYNWCRSMSNYHFTDQEDLSSLDSTLPVVIPITRFNIDEIPDPTKPEPATFEKRGRGRGSENNKMEENDFRRWGYDIDNGYTILNRWSRPDLPKSLKDIIDKFEMIEPQVRYDIQMPGQCFYWHIDAFGGLLTRSKVPEFSRGNFEKHSAADIDQRKMLRIVIFLDDQHQGHHWQQGNLFLQWQKGDCIAWPWKDVPHGTANYGHTPRPTINVTGIVTDKTYEFLENVNKTNKRVI